MLVQTDSGPRKAGPSDFHSTPLGRSSADVTRITVCVREGENVRNQTFTGRAAWALHALIVAGANGCTPITRPAPRWSDYCFKLRRGGVDIETVTESHGGPYSGHHARYVLRSPVTVLEIQRAGEL